MTGVALSAPAVLVTVLLVGCGAAADHERLGDRAYADGHHADALVEYRLALKQGSNASLRAKAGAAALHAGDLVAAAEEYRALAEAGGGDRVTEGADGLELVAKAAVEHDDRAGLAAALTGLRSVAPGRALGAFARQMAQTAGSEPRTAEALNVLPYAAAAAGDARREDSLMFVYAVALERFGRCEQAVPVFEAVARRKREPAVTAQARRSVTSCALFLGRRALDSGRAERAEEWFRRAAAGDEREAVARAAYIGIGDVLFARGAFAEAAEAYQRALADAPPGDSLAQIAAERLNQVANAGAVIR
jgi:tetratricopeptide (TPR) repeat protein